MPSATRGRSPSAKSTPKSPSVRARGRPKSPAPSSAKRAKSPAPKSTGRAKSPAPKSTGRAKVQRKLTRPVGEFGGNIGCFLWMLYIPTQIYYFYGCVVLRQGALAVPDADFWHELSVGLPDGIAIRPTLDALFMIAVWVIFQALCEILLPGKIVEGVTLKNGRKLKYPMNGLLTYFVSHVALYGLVYAELLDPTYIYKNMGALLTGGVIISFVMALWLYIDFGLYWERHVNDPEFEEDYGVFDKKDFFHDFFLGVARNPRIFQFLKVPFDVKRFWNARPGLTLWVIANQSYLAAQYFGCAQDRYGGVSCSDTGDWGNVAGATWLVTIAHWYYIFDYNYNEPAYLTTTDIRHDLFGWMLTYGDFGFLVWFYPLSFAGYLSFLPTPLTDNPVQVAIGTVMYLIGMLLFRLTNIQKHNFRSYIAAGGNLRDYKVWGKPVKYLRTKEGSVLLLSGYWSWARHFNYVGDLTMCLGWAIACSGPSHGFPYVPLGYCAYFWTMDIHRLFRDESRCSIKYGKDWETYKKAAPYRLIPGIF